MKKTILIIIILVIVIGTIIFWWIMQKPVPSVSLVPSAPVLKNDTTSVIDKDLEGMDVGEGDKEVEGIENEVKNL